jgi:hypothetical protein
MPAVLARDSGSVATAAHARMPRADAHPRPRRRATARSHGVSSERVISRDRIARSMLPRFAAVNFQQRLKPRHARGHLASRIAKISPWASSQFPPAGARRPPLPREHGSRGVSVTARGDPAYDGKQTLRMELLCSQHARMQRHGLSDGVLRMGWEWPPNIATRLCSKQHAIRRAHDGRGSLPPWSPL